MLSLKENQELAENHFTEIKDSIRDRIEYILDKKYIHYSNEKIVLIAEELDKLNHFLSNENLKNLITISPENLNLYAQDLHLNNSDYINCESNIYKILYRVFVDYGYNTIDKATFIGNIGVDTCPYCNRNYIYYIDGGKIKPELDHFYPKGIYPLFAACFYNLIPSCQTCNGIGGKYKDDPFVTKITNPYLIKNTDFKFSFQYSLARVNPISGKSNVDISFEKKLQPHIDVFKLDKLYAMHTDHVLELIVKSKLQYSPKYRAYLRSYKNLKFSEEEIDRLILGNFSKEKELHKRPLSKLYSDVGKKLGLIS